MLNNTSHNIAEYINDDFNLLSAYRRYFEGVEAGAAQLVTFSQ
jgi:hypothetical protein